MLDAPRIVEEIRHLLSAGRKPMPEEVSSLAADYMELCATANDRLRACDGLLRRGLRSEAIQLAEQDPNLVDLVSTLDFIERPQWCEYLRRAGEILPAHLLLDEAGALNDAYAAEQPLTHLLQQHRALALARAPLLQRIAALRKIAAADLANTVWQDDLAVLETARQREIETEVGAAALAGDLATLTRLDSEISNTGWRVPPPNSLKALVQTRQFRLRHDSARLELRQLAMQLCDAHSAFDATSARKLRLRWKKLAELTALEGTDGLADLASPALAWLDEEDERDAAVVRFQADVLALEQSLEDGTPRDKLERAYHRAARHELELPPATQRRYRARLDSFRRVAGRRRKLLIAAAAGVLLLLGVITTVAVRRMMFSNSVAAACRRLDSLLEEPALDEAGEFLENLRASSPAVADAEPVRGLDARYRALRKEEMTRRAKFDSELEAARADASFHAPTFASLANAEDVLKSTVSPLALLPDEQKRIQELQKQIGASRVAVQGRVDGDFDRRLNELAKRNEQIEIGDFSPAATCEEALADLRKQLAALGMQDKTVSPPRPATRSALVERVEASLKRLLFQKDLRQWQEMLTSTVGSTSRFTIMLGEFAKRFPETDRAKQFLSVMKEESLWDGLRRFDEAVPRITPKNAGQFVKLAKDLLEDPVVFKFPTMQPIQERLPYLEAVTRRPDHGMPEAIQTLLENPLISGLYTIDIRRENKVDRYYLRKEPTKSQDDQYHFYFVKNFQLEEQHFALAPNKYLIHVNQIVQTDGALIAKSPQWVLAGELQDIIKRWPRDGWETAFCAAIEKILADPTLDPILKVLLAKNFVETGKEGSQVFEAAMRSELKTLTNGGLDPNANWLLPHDDPVDQQRNIAKNLIAALPTLTAQRKNINEKLDWLERVAIDRHLWVGWLAKEEAVGAGVDKWKCLMPKRFNETGDLMVMYQVPGEGTVRFEKIGKLEDHEALVAVEDSPALVEGRPVFMILKHE